MYFWCLPRISLLFQITLLPRSHTYCQLCLLGFEASQARSALEAAAWHLHPLCGTRDGTGGSVCSGTHRLQVFYFFKGKQRARPLVAAIPQQSMETVLLDASQDGQTDNSDAWEQAEFSKGGATAAPASSRWSHCADSRKNTAITKGNQQAFNWPKIDPNEIITGLLSKFKSD